MPPKRKTSEMENVPSALTKVVTISTDFFNKRKKPKIVINCGKPESGKTYVTTQILKDAIDSNLYDEIYVFTATLEEDEYSFIPEYGKRAKENLTLRDLQRLKEYYKKNNKRWCLVLEDQGRSIPWNSNIYLKFLCGFRHYGGDVIVNVQYPTLIPPTFWSVCRHMLIFQQHMPKGIKHLWENGGSTLIDKAKDFQKFCNDNLKERVFLHINTYEKEQSMLCTLQGKSSDHVSESENENENENGKEEKEEGKRHQSETETDRKAKALMKNFMENYNKKKR